MSGTIVNNVARASGTIAATPGGLDWSTAVVTGSTVTVEAGRGYFINTTSNACTVTLPSSAEAGDQIIIADYARSWATNAVTLDSNGLNFQGDPDTYTVEYSTVGQSLNIVYADSTKGWLPVSDDAVADAPVAPVTQLAIFGFGDTGSATGVTNLVNSSGVIAADVSAVGTARIDLAAAGYGVDKGIFRGGYNGSGSNAITNLISTSGVVASDVSGVGTGVTSGIGSSYGADLAIFAYGNNGSVTNEKNLVSSSGVVASTTSGAGTARYDCRGSEYGGDKAIIYGGRAGSTFYNLSNLISNQGVIASDTTGVGDARIYLAGASYNGKQNGVFAYGFDDSSNLNVKNLVNSSGVISADVTGVGTARRGLAATNYGGDKAVFAYGYSSSYVSMSNLVNSSGVIAADVTGVGTGRVYASACGYSLNA